MGSMVAAAGSGCAHVKAWVVRRLLCGPIVLKSKRSVGGVRVSVKRLIYPKARPREESKRRKKAARPPQRDGPGRAERTITSDSGTANIISMKKIKMYLNARVGAQRGTQHYTCLLNSIPHSPRFHVPVADWRDFG